MTPNKNRRKKKKMSRRCRFIFEVIERDLHSLAFFNFGLLKTGDNVPRFFVEVPSLNSEDDTRQICRMDDVTLGIVLREVESKHEDRAIFWAAQLLHYGLFDLTVVKPLSFSNTIKYCRRILRAASQSLSLTVPEEIKQLEAVLRESYFDATVRSRVKRVLGRARQPSSGHSVSGQMAGYVERDQDCEGMNDDSERATTLRLSQIPTRFESTLQAVLAIGNSQSSAIPQHSSDGFPLDGTFTEAEYRVLHAWRDRFCARHQMTRAEFQIMMTRSHAVRNSQWTYDFMTKKEFMQEFYNQLPARKKSSKMVFRRHYNWDPPEDSVLDPSRPITNVLRTLRHPSPEDVDNITESDNSEASQDDNTTSSNGSTDESSSGDSDSDSTDSDTDGEVPRTEAESSDDDQASHREGGQPHRQTRGPPSQPRQSSKSVAGSQNSSFPNIGGSDPAQGIKRVHTIITTNGTELREHTVREFHTIEAVSNWVGSLGIGDCKTSRQSMTPSRSSSMAFERTIAQGEHDVFGRTSNSQSNSHSPGASARHKEMGSPIGLTRTAANKNKARKPKCKPPAPQHVRLRNAEVASRDRKTSDTSLRTPVRGTAVGNSSLRPQVNTGDDLLDVRPSTDLSEARASRALQPPWREPIANSVFAKAARNNATNEASNAPKESQLAGGKRRREESDDHEGDDCLESGEADHMSESIEVKKAKKARFGTKSRSLAIDNGNATFTGGITLAPMDHVLGLHDSLRNDLAINSFGKAARVSRTLVDATTPDRHYGHTVDDNDHRMFFSGTSTARSGVGVLQQPCNGSTGEETIPSSQESFQFPTPVLPPRLASNNIKGGSHHHTSSSQPVTVFATTSILDRTKPYGSLENPHIIPATPQVLRVKDNPVKREDEDMSTTPTSKVNQAEVQLSNQKKSRSKRSQSDSAQGVVTPQPVKRQILASAFDPNVSPCSSLRPQPSFSCSPTLTEVMRKDDRMFGKNRPRMTTDPTRNPLVQHVLSRPQLDESAVDSLNAKNGHSRRRNHRPRDELVSRQVKRRPNILFTP